MDKENDVDVEEQDQEGAPEEDDTEHDDEDNKDDGGDEDEGDKDEGGDDPYAGLSEADLKTRLKKAENAIIKNKGKSKDKAPVKPAADETTIARLEVRGVMEPEDQSYVVRYAKSEGITPLEALNVDIVKDRLAANAKTRKEAASKPGRNGRTGTQGDDVDAGVRRYKRDGTLPENNPILTSKIMDRIAAGD